MSIITITTEAYSTGHALAESVARKMGYPCIGEEITTTAAEIYGISDTKINQTLKNSKSLLSPLFHRQHHIIACLEAVLMEKMLDPNLVYTGFLGLPKIQEVSHAIKVRIIASPEERIRRAQQKENISDKVAAEDRILKEDAQRKRWCKSVYGIDITDPGLYDLVVNLGHMESQDAVETIAMTASHKKFQPMTYSLNCMKNIALSSRIKAAFGEIDPKMEVKSDRGAVYVFAGALKRKQQSKLLAFKERIKQTDGVEHVEVYVKKEIFESKARGN